MAEPVQGPLTQAEVNRINAYLRAATAPNDPNKMLEGWSMPIPGKVWYLNPVQGPAVERYPHEILAYVDMLDAAGIKPQKPTPRSIFNRHQAPEGD